PAHPHPHLPPLQSLHSTLPPLHLPPLHLPSPPFYPLLHPPHTATLHAPLHLAAPPLSPAPPSPHLHLPSPYSSRMHPHYPTLPSPVACSLYPHASTLCASRIFLPIPLNTSTPPTSRIHTARLCTHPHPHRPLPHPHPLAPTPARLFLVPHTSASTLTTLTPTPALVLPRPQRILSMVTLSKDISEVDMLPEDMIEANLSTEDMTEHGHVIRKTLSEVDM
ncbi:proline-rich receptor-like protein kinase PERK2, partial [Penaeus monodon]|uniref:proline-rich receptor-like protein kinase PERK2 n=1 Tax=Penaeus monodon TaxID=6687 RepID=UPI0018A6ED5A